MPETTPIAKALPVREKSYRDYPEVYRSGVTAVDLLAAPAVGTTVLEAGGSLTDGATYNVRVVGVNGAGRTTSIAGTARTPSGGTLTIRIPITHLVGAQSYDVYLSTDADPLWVARVTEAQRAAGCVVTAVGTVTTGSVAGAVDVQVAGTGGASGTTAAVNTAYALDTLPMIDADGSRYVDLDFDFNPGGDTTAGALTVMTFYADEIDGGLYQSAFTTFSYGGLAGNANALRQRLRVEARGSRVGVAVVSIAGARPSLTIYSVLS